MTHIMEATIYQYQVISLGINNADMWRWRQMEEAEDILNNHGNAGWELVAIEGNMAFFKRKIVVQDEER